MLLAEIHGKRNEAITRDEDYLTSAVFGHLRHVTLATFWESFFSRALAVDGRSFADELTLHKFAFARHCEFTMTFWPSYPDFGEPDILVRFVDLHGQVLLLIIEVKLFSPKSGEGEEDQLTRYFDLLRDLNSKASAGTDSCHIGLIYLTHRYALDELQTSVGLISDYPGIPPMFTLQWQDLLEASRAYAYCEPLLGEVTKFLSERGYEAFRGFRKPQFAGQIQHSGFYRSIYFRVPLMLFGRNGQGSNGGFYGQ